MGGVSSDTKINNQYHRTMKPELYLTLHGPFLVVSW